MRAGKTLLLIACWLAAVKQPAAAQPVSSGFFMIVGVTQNCEHRVFSLRNGKVYCVARDPIIPIQQFKSVRSVGTGDKWAVELKFTQEGLGTLIKIAVALPESTFLLVVEGKGVGVFDPNGKCLSSITYDDLKWTEAHLGKLIKK
jgi:hypothetical protein